MQTATLDSASAIASISNTISEMNDIALTIATAIEEQRFVTQEIARSAQEATKGTDVISRSMTLVNSAIKETDTAVPHLMGASTELAEQSTALSGRASDFVARVRAP